MDVNIIFIQHVHLHVSGIGHVRAASSRERVAILMQLTKT